VSPIRFFTDEDVYGAIAPTLRRAGFDAVSVPEVGRLSESDEEQLIWAVSESRMLVTFNVGHFAALHADWLQLGRDHCGIAASVQRPIGIVLRQLLHLAATLYEDAARNRFEFLSDW
jgi:hypothetical protein